jgi:HK97 family phage major capsid protein
MSAQTKAWREERAKLLGQMKEVNARAAAGTPDPVDEETWGKLEARETELTNLISRHERAASIQAELDATNLPETEGTEGRDKKDDKAEYRDAFGRWMGAKEARMIAQADIELLEKRGTSPQTGGSATLGGYIIPEGFQSQIEVFMKMYGGMLEAGSVFTTASGNPLKWPTVNDTSSTGAYIDEATADAVGDVTLAKVDFPLVPTITSKIIKLSWELMEDNGIALDGLIAELAGERVGRFANAQFTTGSTSGKIQGVITGSSSGKTAASATVFTRSELLDLLGSIDPAYLKSPKARWMFNNTTLTAIKKLSFGSGDDRPLWVPSMRDGAPDTLEGLPYTINQDMATAATGTKPIAVGDFGKYRIRVARGMTLEMSRERYWDEGVTGYRVLARMDGRVLNSQAIKFLTMA